MFCCFFFALQMRAERRQPVRPPFVLFCFWALLPLEDPQDPVVRACTLRKWNPRPACGTAFTLS